MTNERPRLLIALVGASNSGKSWVASRLTQNHGFQPVRFADPIKAMLEIGLGLSREQIDGKERSEPIPEFGNLSPLELATSLGRGWGRCRVSPDLWVTLWRRAVAVAGPRVLVDDLRYPNEAEAVRAVGGRIWHIDRPGAQTRDAVGAMAAERFEVDETLVNASSIAALCNLVDEVLVRMVKERSSHD